MSTHNSNASTRSAVYVDAAIDASILNIRKVPDRYREYSEDVDDATKTHQIGGELLKTLIGRGLPYKNSGGAYLFDRTDLENIGLALGLPCPRYSAMRWWARCLEKMKAGEAIRYHLRVSAKCPDPGHDGGCRFSTTAQLEAAVMPGSVRMIAPGSFVSHVNLNAAERFLEEAHSVLFAKLEPLHFYILPAAAPATPEFTEETGLADCRIAAQILCSEAYDLGLSTRPASGYLMAPPFPMKHVWMEFEVDDEWISADPFLLKTFTEWDIIDPQAWPLNRCLDGVLWPVESNASINPSILNHGDSVVPASVTIAHRELLP